MRTSIGGVSRGLRSATLLLALTACSDDVSAPAAPPGGPAPLGLVQVSIEGIGSPRISASARMLGSRADGPRLSLSRAANQDGSGDGTLQLAPISTGSFTEGVRGQGGVRYVFATFRVRNAQEDGSAYDTPRRNVTFLSVATASTIDATAVRGLIRADGAPAAATLAKQVLPTGGAFRDLSTGGMATVPDVLQLLSEEEAAAVATPAEVTGVFPYGFVVRNPNSSTSRDLPASPAADQWDGVVTFAFKLPLQATAAEDPATMRLLFLAVEDSETRVTQSHEEQSAAGQAALEARASGLGATMVTLLPGGVYTGAASTRTLCEIRTAGPAGAPTAILAPCPGLTITPARLTLSLGMTYLLTATAIDESGKPVPSHDIAWSSSDDGIVTVDTLGRLTVRATGAATITAASEGRVRTVEVEATSFLSRNFAAGGSHTCGLTTSGEAFCWGLNARGQLGDETTDSRGVPAKVSGGLVYALILAGQNHTCGLTAEGRAFCWGAYVVGEFQTRPTALGGGFTFSHLTAGFGHTCGLTSGGKAYCWGYNSHGQVGDGTTGAARSLPTPVLGDLTFTTLAAGGFVTCGLTSTGRAYCWGNNENGQLGDGTTVSRPSPAAVTGDLRFIGITVASQHTCGLTPEGEAYCWGTNWGGQLGDGTTVRQRTRPRAVSGGRVFITLVAGSHTCGLTPGTEAYCWGDNQNGELGDGSLIDRFTPTPVAGALAFASLTAGDGYTCGLTGAGIAYCWGYNSWGQLGDGKTWRRSIPNAVSGGITFAVP